MHANVTSDRGGGGGGGSWRLPPDETLQVQDPKDKLDVSHIARLQMRRRARYCLPWPKIIFTIFPQELDYGESHNWKSIVLSLLVIGFVIAGIVTAIYLLGYRRGIQPSHWIVEFNFCFLFEMQICRRITLLVGPTNAIRWIFARRIITESIAAHMGVTYEIRFPIGRRKFSGLWNDK